MSFWKNLFGKKSGEQDIVTSIPSIKIGNQVWMSENLNVDKFRNGDPIPEIKSNSEWQRAGEEGKPAWCYYDNDPANGKIYGRLYNWYAVNDPRGLALKRWHVPSDEEWTKLTDYLGGEIPGLPSFILKAGGKLKSTSLWASPNTGATNESCFSALPGGDRRYNGEFALLNFIGTWWSLSPCDTDYVWVRKLGYDDDNVFSYYDFKSNGFSVRCIRDK